MKKKNKAFTPTPKFGVSLRSKRGFTLFEILIVFAIIAAVSLILVVNMRKGEKQYQLQLVAQQIAQSIRRAQDMALTSFKYQGNIPFAYGLFFNKQNPTSYIIFADKNGNNKYDAPDGNVDTINIEKGVEIGSLSREPRLHITFSLPDGFTGIEPSANSATITIKKTGGTCPQDCKDIIIEETGRISIQ